MARFAFDGSFGPKDAQSRLRRLKDSTKDVGRHRHQVVTVPAGKTKLVILDDKALAGATGAQFLQLHSDVEDISWWPIDSATPSVNEDTRAFGPLLDMSAPDFEHNHGSSGSNIVAAHTGGSAGTASFYSVLPCFQNYVEDEADPTGDHGAASVDTTDPAGGVLSDGHARDLSPARRRTLQYLIGQDNYYNLGSDPTASGDRADSLEFYPILYIEDPTQYSAIIFLFYCWPFTRGFLDPVDGANSAGDTVWSTSDRFLCRNALSGINTVGWDYSTLIAGAFWSGYIDGADLVAGTSTYRMDKRNIAGGGFSPQAAGGEAFDDGGAPTWSRVTMIGMQTFPSSPTATSSVELINILFRPRPGLVRQLRPYEQTTDQPWSTSSIPAIAIRNDTDLDATVQVVFGAT